MTDTRCRMCLEHAATCEARRLFAGRACCCECTHTEHDQEGAAA